jgi:hypothetical protein
MTDGARSPEEGLITPQAKNQALREIVSHFPKSLPLSENETEKETEENISRMMKRGDSEYVFKLIDKSKVLVDTAPITAEFKTYILDELKEGAKTGLTGTSGQDYLMFFLDTDHPSSGGIFDRSRAIELERIGIEHQTDLVRRLERSFVKITGHAASPDIWKDVNSWKQSFKTHYGQSYIQPAPTT